MVSTNAGLDTLPHRVDRLNSRLDELQQRLERLAERLAFEPILEPPSGREREIPPPCASVDDELLRIQQQLEAMRDEVAGEPHVPAEHDPAWSAELDDRDDGIGSGRVAPALFLPPAADEPAGDRPLLPPLSGTTARGEAGADWLQSYQHDEVDEGVRDYIQRLLRRDDSRPAAPVLAVPQRNGNAPAKSPAVLYPPDNASDFAQHEAISPPAASGVDSPARPAPGLHDPRLAGCEAAGAPRPIPEGDVSSGPSQPPPSASPARARIGAQDCEADFRALRELADSLAREAVESFERKRLAAVLLGKVPVLLVALASGIVMLYWAVDLHKPSMFTGAAVAFIVALLSIGQLAAACRTRSFANCSAAKSDREPPRPGRTSGFPA